ncbi:MAG: hypothetical protein A49_12300 [Methyloceanibacter sp.]|nr:MAG: hypothetical protein A49_12300 [Methyloceanibacter sp.]
MRAKTVRQIHGIDAPGTAVIRRPPVSLPFKRKGPTAKMDGRARGGDITAKDRFEFLHCRLKRSLTP